MKTDAERKRAERARKVASGLRRVELWLTHDEQQYLADKLKKLRSK